MAVDDGGAVGSLIAMCVCAACTVPCLPSYLPRRGNALESHGQGGWVHAGTYMLTHMDL